MKKILLALAMILLANSILQAESNSSFEPSNGILLSIPYSRIGPAIGIAADFSVVPHFGGTMGVSLPFLNPTLITVEGYLKGFLHQGNVGLYGAIGSTAFVSVAYFFDLFSAIVMSIGYKAVIFDFLVFDFSVHASPASIFSETDFFDWWDDPNDGTADNVILASYIKLAIGIRL